MLIAIVAFSLSIHFCCPKCFFFHLGSGSQMLLLLSTWSVTNYIGFFVYFLNLSQVYHLQGGILKYLEEVPETESLWEGECFVFDKRVSVEHGLVPGNFKLCYGCKKPVSDADMEAPEWEYGVSCPYCYESKSEEEKERARARQRQFERWGIIGGPDKGRKPVKTVDDNNLNAKELLNSS